MGSPRPARSIGSLRSRSRCSVRSPSPDAATRPTRRSFSGLAGSGRTASIRTRPRRSPPRRGRRSASASPGGASSPSIRRRAIRFDTVTPAPRHPTRCGFIARDAAGAALADETWLSIGGGFIVRDGAGERRLRDRRPLAAIRSAPGAELLARGREGRPLDRRTHAAPTRRRLGREARRRPCWRASSTSCSPASTGA